MGNEQSNVSVRKENFEEPDIDQHFNNDLMITSNQNNSATDPTSNFEDSEDNRQCSKNKQKPATTQNNKEFTFQLLSDIHLEFFVPSLFSEKDSRKPVHEYF